MHFTIRKRHIYLLAVRNCVDLLCGKSIQYSLNYLLRANFVSISSVAKCPTFCLFACLLRIFVSKKSVSATDEKRVLIHHHFNIHRQAAGFDNWSIFFTQEVSIWVVFGKYLGSIRAVFGKYLVSIWLVFVKYLVSIW